MEVLFESKWTRIDYFEENWVAYVRKTVKWRFAHLMAAHEVKVLERLKGVKWVQELVRQDSPVSFISVFVEWETLREREWKEIPEDTFEKLRHILREIHSRWVADPDFAHSVDIIITPSWEPVVIDLASSIVLEWGKITSWFKLPVFKYIKQLNLKYLEKRKARYLPHLMTEAEREQAEEVWIWPKLALYWRKLWRQLKKYPTLR